MVYIYFGVWNFKFYLEKKYIYYKNRKKIIMGFEIVRNYFFFLIFFNLKVFYIVFFLISE